jgi:predicted RND superfamily exporter protein
MDAIYSKYRFSIFLLFIFFGPIVVLGAIAAMKTNSNKVADWLPEEFEETQRLNWFVDKFGGDELLMISWDDCTLEDSRVDLLAERLRQPITVDGRQVQLYRQVLTGREVLQRLTDEPLKLKKQRALLRLEGWLIGPDRYTTCLLALVSKQGAENRHAAVQYVYQCAEQECGITPDQLHIAGPTMEGVAIDQASAKHFDLLKAISMVICFGLMIFGMRSFLIGLMVYGTALLSQQFALALVIYTGSQMDSVMLMLPSLVYVLCISSGVHIVNYYRDAIREQGLAGAPRRAIRYAWAPCWLSAVTTSVGLLSLVVSMIVPIRKFGGYASASVLAGTGIMILLLPCLLEEFPQLRWAERLRAYRREKRSRLTWEHLLAGVSRFHVLIVVVAVIAVLVAGWGVTRLKATARLHNLFRSDAKILTDYDWLENHVGPLVPIEVVVRIPQAAPKTLLERIQFVEEIRRRINGVEGIDRTISAATFAPSLPEKNSAGWRQATRRAVFSKKLEGSLKNFISTGYVKIDGEDELWRISARVRATSDIDYGPLLAALESEIEPVLDRERTGEMPNVSVLYCGGVPLVHKAQHQLMDDLINSFMVAFGLIAVIMIVVLRSFRAGLVSMIPNVFPAFVVFGAMGWVGFEIEVGSMLTATAALGIAVDDTLHLIAAFRHGLAGGRTRREAILTAYHRCGAAMIQTSLICGLGLLVFSFSPFAPIARFGWLMGAMLGTALLGDLVILPAVLIGRLGRVFEPSRSLPDGTVPVWKKKAA